jgi:hypothetical protein
MLFPITFSLGLTFSLQVEAALVVSPYVENIMLDADPFHSYCVALVVAAQPALEEWASKKGIAYTDFAELCEKEETIKELQASLLEVCLSDNVLASRIEKGASGCLAYIFYPFQCLWHKVLEKLEKQHLCNTLEVSCSNNKATGYQNMLMKYDWQDFKR